MKDNIILLLSFTWSLIFTLLKVTKFPDISWWIIGAPAIAIAVCILIAIILVLATRGSDGHKKDSSR